MGQLVVRLWQPGAACACSWPEREQQSTLQVGLRPQLQLAAVQDLARDLALALALALARDLALHQAHPRAAAPALALPQAHPQAAAPVLARPQALRLLQALAWSLVHLPDPLGGRVARQPLPAQSLVHRLARQEGLVAPQPCLEARQVQAFLGSWPARSPLSAASLSRVWPDCAVLRACSYGAACW